MLIGVRDEKTGNTLTYNPYYPDDGNISLFSETKLEDNVEFYIRKDADPNNLKLSDIKGRFKKEEKEEILNHPIFGELKLKVTPHKFTKLFQVIGRPIFDNKGHELYWYRLLYFLEKDTNAIYIKRSNNMLSLATKREHIARNCSVRKSTCNNFINESIEKKYIAEVPIKGCNYYFINPKFAKNGNKTPILLYEIFDINPEIY